MNELSKVKGYKNLPDEWQRLFRTTFKRHRRYNSFLGVPLEVALIEFKGHAFLKVDFVNDSYKYKSNGKWR